MYDCAVKTYSTDDFRKNIRRALDEARTEPILIKRYDETFIVQRAEQVAAVDSPGAVKLGTTPVVEAVVTPAEETA